jgi:predicted small lipoprotein YifL
MVRDNEELAVTRPRCFRLGMTAALAAVLLLPGCGRKGPLDPPPGADVAQQAPADASETPHQAFDQYGRPVAPRGRKKPHFLDFLID